MGIKSKDQQYKTLPARLRKIKIKNQQYKTFPDRMRKTNMIKTRTTSTTRTTTTKTKMVIFNIHLELGEKSKNITTTMKMRANPEDTMESLLEKTLHSMKGKHIVDEAALAPISHFAFKLED